MRVEEIIKLLDAGFSKDDIMQLEQQQEPQQDPQEPQPEPKKEPQQDPQEPQQDPQQDMTKAVNEFKAAVNDFKKEIIAANILNSKQDPDSTVTAETAVANIINPFKKEGM